MVTDTGFCDSILQHAFIKAKEFDDDGIESFRCRGRSLGYTFARGFQGEWTEGERERENYFPFSLPERHAVKFLLLLLFDS